MENETTTAIPPVDDGAAQAAQPSEPVQAAATQPTEPTNAQEPTEPVFDNSEWLKNKGIDPDDPQAVSKLADMARNAEKAMHEKAQQASELKKTLTDGTQQAIAKATAGGETDTAQVVLARVAALELEANVGRFFSDHPEAKEHEAAMAKLVTDRPEIGALVTQGALGIDDLYVMTRGSDPTAITEAKTQGAQQALQQLANKQTANAVTGAATNSSVTPAEEDRLKKLWAS